MTRLEKFFAIAAFAVSILGLSAPASANTYLIDTKGAHAFINFKVSHLGYSWVHGNFTDFSGSFKFDPAKPEASSIKVNINTNSVNSSHAERDKHLRGKKFLNTSQFPEASFVSTRIESDDGQNARIYGDFTLKGVTKKIVIEAVKVGEGRDPWGGYRAGFSGTTQLSMADFDMNLGPASADIHITLEVEGIRQ
ncbi:YceI family protein [Endozoicomonas gorgoniicola]|uniref:YceI family protein n=1 Tax=Endozoicomonas gorgoniicola TaxID=1234144 RepID=A0ABT3N1A1_9GAMM|nr:YceI family protein [Endozoicomonas gorgoniicola]MCW7555412.1 YceI family protein [Endozoicomonas gorgoniicola]